MASVPVSQDAFQDYHNIGCDESAFPVEADVHFRPVPSSAPCPRQQGLVITEHIFRQTPVSLDGGCGCFCLQVS